MDNDLKTSKKFREELNKIMPKYKWTVHKSGMPDRYINATGIQSSGFNRLSTLCVIKRINKNNETEYEAKSAGYGKNTDSEYICKDSTLARALRGLQDYYKQRADYFLGLYCALEHGREK